MPVSESIIVMLLDVLLSNSGAYALYFKLRLTLFKSPIAFFNFKIIFPPVFLPSGSSIVYKLGSIILPLESYKTGLPKYIIVDGSTSVIVIFSIFAPLAMLIFTE